MSSQQPRLRAVPRVSTPTTEWKAPKFGVTYASAVKPSGFNAAADRFFAEFPCDKKGLHRNDSVPKQVHFKAPPIGIGARKAVRMVQEKNKLKPSEDVKTDIKDEERLDCNQLKSVTGKFARPLLPVLGENLAQSWQDITKAPVAFQVQELLGDRVTRSRSSLTEIQSEHITDEVGACGVRAASSSTPRMNKSDINITEFEHAEKVTAEDPLEPSNSHVSLPSISASQSMLHSPRKYALEPRFDNDVSEGSGTSLRDGSCDHGIKTEEEADLSEPSSERTNQTNSDESDKVASSRLVYFPSSYPSSTISLSSNGNEMNVHMNYDELESISHDVHKISIEDLSTSSHEASAVSEANKLGEQSRPLMTNGAVKEFSSHKSSITTLPTHLNAPPQRKYSGIVYFPGSEFSANSSTKPLQKKTEITNFYAEFY